MRDVLLCNCLTANSSLNRYQEKVWGNGFFDFLADRFGELINFLLMNKKSQGVDRVIHDVYDNFDDVTLLKISIFVFEGSISMSERFYLIYEIDDDFS